MKSRETTEPKTRETAPTRLSPHDERRVGVVAGTDPRTVRAYLDPEKRGRVRSTVASRIVEALRTCGFATPETP